MSEHDLTTTLFILSAILVVFAALLFVVWGRGVVALSLATVSLSCVVVAIVTRKKNMNG